MYYNENEYQGSWKKDRKNGFGIFYYKDKDERYEGEFLDGLRNCQGTYFYNNDDK